MTVYKMTPKEQAIVLRNVKSNLGVYIERLQNLPPGEGVTSIIAHLYDAIDDIDLLAEQREIVLLEKMPT